MIIDPHEIIKYLIPYRRCFDQHKHKYLCNLNLKLLEYPQKIRDILQPYQIPSAF